MPTIIVRFTRGIIEQNSFLKSLSVQNSDFSLPFLIIVMPFQLHREYIVIDDTYLDRVLSYILEFSQSLLERYVLIKYPLKVLSTCK